MINLYPSRDRRISQIEYPTISFISKEDLLSMGRYASRFIADMNRPIVLEVDEVYLASPGEMSKAHIIKDNSVVILIETPQIVQMRYKKSIWQKILCIFSLANPCSSVKNSSTIVRNGMSPSKRSVKNFEPAARE